MGNITFEQLPQAVSTLIERVEQLAGKVDEVLGKAAGKDTDQLKKSVAEARSVADLGIKLSITIEGWQNLVKVQKWMQSFATTYSVFISDVSPNSQKTDWREQRDEATHVALQKINEAFTKTDAGRLESLYAETKEYKAQLTALDSMLLTDGQRAEAAEHLNALLNDRYKKIDGILKKGKSSSEAAANRAAKALAAYDEELAKLTQSSRELEQVKIEEKLAKIAKDAKLPAAEMEKLGYDKVEFDKLGNVIGWMGTGDKIIAISRSRRQG